MRRCRPWRPALFRLPILVSALVFLILQVSSPTHAALWAYEGEHGGIQPSLHARSYSLFYTTPPALKALTPGSDHAAVVQRIRVGFTSWARDWLRAEAAWDLLPIVSQSDLASRFTVANQGGLRLADFDAQLHEGHNWRLQHNLDRLALHFHLGAVDLHVGRQALGFGSSRLLPAADIFSPFGPGTIDTEFKRGMDAVRLVATLGEYHSLEITSVFRGTSWQDGLYLAMWRATFPELFDMALAAGSSWGGPTVLFDVSGAVGGAAWYLEASGRFDPETSAEHQIRVTAGIDHQLTTSLRLVFEMHYSSVGSTDTRNWLKQNERLGYAAGEVYLLGPAYAALLLAWQAAPLHIFHLATTQSLTEAGALLSPGWQYDFADSASVAIGALVPIAKRSSATLLDPQREFNLYPTVVFADLRLAF